MQYGLPAPGFPLSWWPGWCARLQLKIGNYVLNLKLYMNPENSVIKSWGDHCIRMNKKYQVLHTF